MASNYQFNHDVTDLALSTLTSPEIRDELIKPRIAALKHNPQAEIGPDFWLRVARAGRKRYCQEWGKREIARFNAPEVMEAVAARIARQYETEIRIALAMAVAAS